MELKDFVGKPCTAKVSYEFFPKKKTKIDLNIAAKEIEKIGNIDIKSKVLLITVVNGKTVSIFKNGKILVRGEKDEKNAKKIAQKICSVLKESPIEKKSFLDKL